MKRLYLLRHAQALPMEEGRDFDRPLTPKGQDDARALGAFMLDKGYVPELILCSGAQRTRDTHEQIMHSFENSRVHNEFSDDIYDAHRSQLFKMVQDLGYVRSAMIIGHNPTIYELCALLAAQGQETVMNRLTAGYVPGTFSVFDFHVEDWAALDPDKGVLVDYVSPIDYNAEARPTRWM